MVHLGQFYLEQMQFGDLRVIRSNSAVVGLVPDPPESRPSLFYLMKYLSNNIQTDTSGASISPTDDLQMASANTSFRF